MNPESSATNPPSDSTPPSERDPGQQLVDLIYANMMIDREWSTRDEHGFTWWGHRLAQSVRSTAKVSARGLAFWRVEIVTGVVRNVEWSEKTLDVLNDHNRSAHVSPLVGGPNSVWFENVLDVTSDNLERLKPIAMVCAGLQISDAERKADSLALMLQGEVAVSAHPANGPRARPDELVHLISNYFIPGGRGPFLPTGKEKFNALRGLGWKESKATATSFLATFAAGDVAPTATFSITTRHRHPMLGAGVLVKVTVPVATEPIDALALNVGAIPLVGVPRLGAWVSGEETTWTAFIPAVGAQMPTLQWLAETAQKRVVEDIILRRLSPELRWMHRCFVDNGIPMAAADDAIYQNATYSISFVNRRPSKPQIAGAGDSGSKMGGRTPEAPVRRAKEQNDPEGDSTATHSTRDAEAAGQLRLPDCES